MWLIFLFFRSWIRWDRFDAKKLIEAETTLFEKVSTPIQSRLIPIKLFNASIYTISTKTKAYSDSKIPFVCVHGFGGGVGIWASSINTLASHRPVHAIDLLGFGRSSRPNFHNDPLKAESEFVQAIEDWRCAMKIDKMILMGHSFGGYLSTAYALQHSERVRHLVLVDPWGYSVSGDAKVSKSKVF